MDADGAFEGEFRLKLEEAGVHLVVIPPEAHWRIGTVERKNAVLRTVVEKLLDEILLVVSGGGHNEEPICKAGVVWKIREHL